jgi:hypothetical protein
MRLPRFRFTVRRMMVTVAIVGTAMGVADCWQRRHSHRRRAEDLRMSEMMLILTARDLSPEVPQIVGTSFNDRLPDGTPIRVEGLGTGRRVYIPAQSKIPADKATIAKAVEAIQREAKRMHRLRVKYQSAARYPWLPVAPDPPEPK